jgi:hypothetical protein
MRNFVKLLLPLVAVPMIPSTAFAAINCCTGVICAWGTPYCSEFLAKKQLQEQRSLQNKVNMVANPAAHGYSQHTRPVLTAQYMPTQYYPAQMMGGGGAPVIVPPTVINTQGYEHNSSKKSCKESMIDLFLFSVRRTTGDCTP